MNTQNTEILVRANINDGASGELIETVGFIYCVSRPISDVDDLSKNDVRRIENAVEELREYEPVNGDIYRVDCIILENPTADEMPDETEHRICDSDDSDEE